MNWIKDNDGISDNDFRNVFKYEKKETTAITWSTDEIVSYVYLKQDKLLTLGQEPTVHTLDDFRWETWLQEVSRSNHA